ncbi:hypothetical protein PR202_ga16924 [Eleusine coracana subsp. coracana]|uniref:GDSL esterase/lipase n=1 Tax=Eleusine coracana subsp. coracana TaxID=191504 RepID=A0AAV5CNZ2_ELECO|nr:hypothetical protein QOZ80_7BG0611480 [Eleusine coracana subsp. coracana]GJM99790.1 hypothetical protein PR202_ga16924 [Eleusine coracana subsp. coracana]
MYECSGGHVEGRPSRHRRGSPSYKLFVFGDSFVDVGNINKTENSLMSRSWYYPYGSSDAANHKRPTGRFSDGVVQSDLVAEILGLEESPPAFRTLGPNDEVDPSGVNFAVGGTGVSLGTPTLRQQVEQLRSLMRSGAIRKRDLDDSVALISISAGRDYARISGSRSSSDEMMNLSRSVTNEMKNMVKRLQDIGVSKVLVNSMPPLGCTPWESVYNNYTRCGSNGNMMSDVHNTALRQTLSEEDGVLLLDLNYAFKGFVEDGGAGQEQFTSKLAPCCYSSVRGGYCGQVDSRGRKQYSLCDNSEDFFFWDYMHPTQAAWKAVMSLLGDPIRDFLD